MREFIRKKGIWIGLAAIIIALIAAFSAFSGGTDHVAGAANATMGPAKRATASVVGFFESIYSRMFEYDKLAEENAELRERNAEYEREYQDYVEVTEENKELKALLGFSESHQDFQYEPVVIDSWNASNWSSSFTLNKGSSSGVELQDAVISKDGYLIGRVTNLGSSTATVTTVLDTKSSIGAGLYSTADPVVAQGDFALMNEGRLKLLYLPKDANVAKDDVVYTSGVGSVPSGLIIGYVDDVQLSSSGLDDYAIVRPAIDYSSLTRVYVITDFGVVEE